MKKTSSSYCPICEERTLHAKEGPSNVLHLLLTICTLGVWLLVWIPLLLTHAASKQRCQRCGHKHSILDRPKEAKTA